MSVRIKILAVIYVVVLAGIIILANLRETQFLFRPLRQLPLGDKLGHFFLMGMLSFLINLVLKAGTIRLWKINILQGTLIVLAIITIEEVSQIFIRGRTFDWGDLVANLLGIIIFGETARLICRKFFVTQKA